MRAAVAEDADAVQAIYAHHVAHSTATFDTVAPDEAFWREKIDAVVARGWPFLVVERDGEVAGYAYATQFRDRAAYSHTCENSIYIADSQRGSGLGAILLTALVDAAGKADFEQMIAVIGGGEPASVALHGKLGFVEVGRMRQVGMKFGRRLDTVYMQLSLHR
ncbi:GNAT family N-acetyltransferase [Qipengyuania sp. XHP0211]|uniref:GNAT family N-acetyltransferase n=1 Tax=Qipengyuania sp. XHP0211 TaxID=3038079 RepID=UPI00241D7585|nr:GNAT family N-acetyltransferase [Qipengyuania sp. XHP0211]MDG5751115.1 GNAT family N-acetyltransferase [Qipengyuania sp. XHP0211]